MPTEWRVAHEAALREQDPAKVAKACEKARRLISDRLVELSKLFPEPNHFLQTVALSREREELDEALDRLVIHEYKHKGHPLKT